MLSKYLISKLIKKVCFKYKYNWDAEVSYMPFVGNDLEKVKPIWKI